MKTESLQAGDHENPSERSTTRRGFAKTLAAAAGVPFLSHALPLAAEAAPAPSPTPTPAPGPPSPVVEAMAEAMKAKFGKHLSPEQFDAAKKSLDRAFRNAERMKGVKLTNADEPDVVFFAAIPGAR